jgi:hypothetical protein
MCKVVCSTAQPNVVFMHIIETDQYLYDCCIQGYSKQDVPKAIKQRLWL